MSTHFITIHVLAAGDLFKDVLNAITTFMNQRDFAGLLRITALIGIVMVAGGFLKSRDPLVFAKWFLGYVLCTNVLLLPRTSVLIDDLSLQSPKIVDNVPVVFALTASVVTTIGYGLAESYDALFTTIGDFTYTKTGALFGSRLIQATYDFRVLDPSLKEDLDNYFRSCVVGDIRLNQKYSIGDLANSREIWSLISSHASPLRMTSVKGKDKKSKLVTCLEASRSDGEYSLKARLDAEIKKAYTVFGLNLFGKPSKTTYEKLFETHLTSAAYYYQGLTDTSSNIFLQAMMINAMSDGITHYQAFTDSTASVVNHEFSKSQLQHRWSWEIAGLKALWYLPLLHTLLTLLLFGVFPLVLAMSTLPGGARILMSYLQFFFSLQCWPVLFAILNLAMTKYGMSHTLDSGAMTMVNLEKITELHRDISGVAGYMMMLIPFFANGLVSNLSAAFNGLATSMTSHLQGSTMAVAGEAAAGSFGLGQTSFYNTSANSFSANKHDSNWSHLHGMQSEQAGSGVIKTITGNGESVFDVSPGMTKSAVSIHASEGLSGTLNQAYESSKQALESESAHFQTSLSNFAHRAVQLSALEGHDLRLGQGVSSQESAHYSKALSTMSHIAEDVAKRVGVGKEEAFAALTNGGFGASAGLSTDHTLWGGAIGKGFGFRGGVDAHLRYDRTSTSADRFHEHEDKTVSAREAQDFNQAFNVARQFTQNHHFDESHSEAASLSQQMGADLRNAATASHNFDASFSKTQRISEAKSYVESHSSQVNADFNQAFPAYVAERVGSRERDALFEHPGDSRAVQQLETLAQDFIAVKQDALIAKFGNSSDSKKVDAFYQQEAQTLHQQTETLQDAYQQQSRIITKEGHLSSVGVDAANARGLSQAVQQQLNVTDDKVLQGGHHLQEQEKNQFNNADSVIKTQKYRATEGVLPGHAVDKTTQFILNKKEKNNE